LGDVTNKEGIGSGSSHHHPNGTPSSQGQDGRGRELHGGITMMMSKQQEDKDK
jgi:hypothetical protein